MQAQALQKQLDEIQQICDSLGGTDMKIQDTAEYRELAAFKPDISIPKSDGEE